MTTSSSECVFCTLESKNWVQESRNWIAFRDRFPVSPLHTLLVPKTHRVDFFDLYEQEHQDFHRFLSGVKQDILGQDDSITGFNIGMNCGASAGQIIFHCHFHLIPRRDGDMTDPTGGVRGVIPEKQK